MAELFFEKICAVVDYQIIDIMPGPRNARYNRRRRYMILVCFFVFFPIVSQKSDCRLQSYIGTAICLDGKTRVEVIGFF